MTDGKKRSDSEKDKYFRVWNFYLHGLLMDFVGPNRRLWRGGRFMDTAIAIIIILLGALAWVGQLFSALVPLTAARLGLIESEEMVDPAFYADARGEAIWDSFVLWGLPLAGVLLLLEHPWWPHLGLAGGAIYLYFAGRGVISRMMLRRREIRIGLPSTALVFNVALLLWGISGGAMVALSLLARS